MKKSLPLLLAFLLIGFMGVQAQNLSSGPTLSFSNTTGFGDNIATDGEGGAAAISDINIQVLPVNNSGTKMTADPLEFHGADWGTPSIITYGGINPFYAWSIRSDNGADFSLVAFDIHNWGDWSGTPFSVQAFRNGVSLGTVSFAGNTNNTMTHVANQGTLTSIFQKVDEVRIYEQDGQDSWTGINNIKIASPASTLPVTWQSFTAIQKDNGVLLNWSTSEDLNTKEFEVQCGDGSHWNTISSIDAAINNNKVNSYSYFHRSGLDDARYYRIMERDVDGKENYSKIIRVNFGSQKTLTIYTNPVVNGALIVQLDNKENLQLFNSAGNLLLQKQMQAGMQQVQLPCLQKGIYFIRAGRQMEKLLIE